MTRRDFLASTLLYASLPQFIAKAATQQLRADPNQGDFTSRLEQIRQRLGLPSLGAVVVSKEGILAQGVTGFCKVGQNTPVDLDAHWQLGSITKTFTGTLIGRLVQEGKLTWTSTLGEVFPELLPKMADRVSEITIQQLILHKSGMGGDVIGWEGSPAINQPGLSLSQRRYLFIALAVTRSLSFSPGSQKNYSNQGYNTLGAVAERVTGKSWEELIEFRICQPLGIESIIFGEPALHHPNTEPWPHALKDGQFSPIPPVPDNFYGYHTCNPAGGISLRLADFGRWMQAHLATDTMKEILDASTFQTLHTSEEVGGISPFAVGNSRQWIGKFISHSGSNGRNWASHFILMDKEVGVFYATNVPLPGTNTLREEVDWFSLNTLIAHGLPKQWPSPSLSPTQVSPDGILQGESMELARISGGQLQFQTFDNLSERFQIWWFEAKENNQLVLRGQVSRPGRYEISALFGGNVDFGSATIQIGEIRTRLNFKTGSLKWGVFKLGETVLQTEPFDVEITAHGNAGTNGIKCHLALDAMQFRYMGAVQ